MPFKDNVKKFGSFVGKKLSDHAEAERQKEVYRHKDKRSLLKIAESGTGPERNYAIRELKVRRLNEVAKKQGSSRSNQGGGFDFNDPFEPQRSSTGKKKKGKPFDPFASPF